MIDHKHMREQLVSFALGELSESERVTVSAHVGACERCRAELTRLEKLLHCAGRRKDLSADEPQYESARAGLLAVVGGLACPEHPARARVAIWRAIMRKRPVRLAAAAVIVAALLISLSHFNGTVVKAVEFEEITQAMQQVPWLHARGAGFERQIGGVAEQWIGFASKIHAGKWANGKVSFASEKDHKQFVYDPNSNTITVRYLEASAIDLTSPATLLTSMHKLLAEQGAQVSVRRGSYQGRKVQVQDITLSNVGGHGESQALTLYVDPESKLLYGAKIEAVDAAGKVVMAGTITFDYPSSGPQSIYDLGVPRDARIGGDGTQTGFQTLLEQYRRMRAEATNEYIAIITHAANDGIVTRLDVDYRSGRKHRLERHSVFHSGEVLDRLWPQYKEQLGNTFDSLLSWTRRHYDDPRAGVSIYLYDGGYYCSTRQNGENGWSKQDKLYLPGGDPAPSISLVDVAWPRIVSTARIIEDDYARQNGLICIESLSQGHVDPREWASLPGRFLSYLDPSWDYLCRRRVTERRPDADWQQDKDWLAGVDPNKVRDSSITVDEITEAFQAPNGHWYPKVVVERSGGIREDDRHTPLRTSTTKRIYPNLSLEFPEGIFDIDKLPGQ
jgi:anti-sigma factor RsiW